MHGVMLAVALFWHAPGGSLLRSVLTTFAR